MEDSNTVPTETKKKFNPVYVIGGLIVLGVAVALIVSGNRKKDQQGTEAVKNDIPNVQTSAVVSPVKEFTVNGSSFDFDPKTVTVNKGDTVKITFVDGDGTHDLVVEGYNVSTKRLSGGGSDTIQFIADKTGCFEYYCSVSNHRDLGMKGVLVVQ